MPRARKKVAHYNTRINPFTGKRERVKNYGPIRMNPLRKRPGTVGGMRKRRTTPRAPLPFSYGWESVYKR